MLDNLNLDATGTMVLLACAAIIVLVLLAKFISKMLKLAAVAVMVAFILFFLRKMGLF